MKLKDCIGELIHRISYNIALHAFFGAHLFFHSPQYFLAIMYTWGMVLLSNGGNALGQVRMLFLVEGVLLRKKFMQVILNLKISPQFPDDQVTTTIREGTSPTQCLNILLSLRMI